MPYDSGTADQDAFDILRKRFHLGLTNIQMMEVHMRTLTAPRPGFILSACLLCFTPLTTAYANDTGSKVMDWQLKRLFHPTEGQLRAEAKNKVFIYHGLKDFEVDRAMDEQFDRIQNIMTANIIITDGKGRPRHNPKTGAVLTEDDGC